jgi:hypothetical protein
MIAPNLPPKVDWRSWGIGSDEKSAGAAVAAALDSSILRNATSKHRFFKRIS